MPTELTADVNTASGDANTASKNANTASEEANVAPKDGKFSGIMLLFEIQIGSITTDSLLGISTFLQQFLNMLFKVPGVLKYTEIAL